MDEGVFSKLLKKAFYKEFLKGIEEGQGSELLLFLVKEGKEFSKEYERYKEDYENYKTGVFLWWSEEYPKFIKFLNLFKVNFVFPCYENMKLVVKDYYNLIENAKNLNSVLFNEELNESIQFVFKKNVNPINILKEKNPLIKLINNELEAYIKKSIPKLNDYFKQIIPEFKNYLV